MRYTSLAVLALERDVEATFEPLAGLDRRLAADAGLVETRGEPAPLVVIP